jgi:hypothetical protein
MADNAELHSKILSFLAGEFARKDLRQCVGVDLLYAPGNGFRDEEIRKWVRADQPELFDNFANVETLVVQVLEIATGEVDAKPPGKHRFIVRTRQHANDRATLSFALAPGYAGGDDAALVAGAGGGGGAGGRDGNAATVLMNHAGQLMRINAQTFEGSIRVLGAQNQDMRLENSELRAENILLRREVDEARSNKMDREFQIAMAAEKNARTNAGFQKLLQIGTIVAAKIGGADENQGGGSSSIGMLIAEFGNSLRPDQVAVLMNTLDMGQKMMFMEIMKMVQPPEPGQGPGANLPPGNVNGAPSP